MKRAIPILILFALAGCDSFTAAPYGISADNDLAVKAIAGTRRASVGAFILKASFDPGCRLAGPIQLPSGLTFEGYIQKAFSDELKVGGIYDDKSPIILQGTITNLAFSSNSGAWDVALTLASTNNKSMAVSEHYEFHTSFTAVSACHDVADAFQPTVQALVGKIVTDPNFPPLLTQ